MYHLLLAPVLLVAMNTSALTIFDFSPQSSLNQWYIVNDGVMGGLSQGALELTDEGHGLFKGKVRLENNGGFTSIRYATGKVQTSKEALFRLRVKGDGKNYQFRIKHSTRDYQSYITTFATTGDWETIEIPLHELYPSFRGRRLNMANYDHEFFEELVFLIGNKKAESFELLIDEISLITPQK